MREVSINKTVRLFRQSEFRTREIRDVEAVAAGRRNVVQSRSYGPGYRLVYRAIGQHHDPDDVVFQNEDMRHRAGGTGEIDAAWLPRAHAKQGRIANRGRMFMANSPAVQRLASAGG